MKHSRMIIAVFSTGALLMSQGALSAINLNSSRSNIYKIDANDPSAEQACLEKGGKISTNKNVQKICTEKAQESRTTVKSSKSNTSDRSQRFP